MNSAQLLSYTTLFYFLATFFYLVMLVFRSQKPWILAMGSGVVGFLLQTGGIGLRWAESYQQGIGRAPLTNMYESLVFFAWTILLTHFVLEWRSRNRFIGAFTTPFAFLAMAYASFAPEISDKINPLVPALKSNWLIAHVITCFIGYASFAVACGLGIMYLVKTWRDGNKENAATRTGVLPPLAVIDDLTHKCILFGFLWLTAGIITGAVWANSAWGTYWSWDPKETWSLITWFVYALTLHARLVRGWKGKRIAWLAIGGFLAVIFTYYGVNFILSGLHSYGR